MMGDIAKWSVNPNPNPNPNPKTNPNPNPNQAAHQDRPPAAGSLEYTRYRTAPGPPMPEFAQLTGHGSYELAFRDASLYSWLLQHECARCKERPLAAWRPLGKDQGVRPRGAGVSPY